MQAQEKLAQFLLRSRLDQRAVQRRQTLLALVNTDVELLLSMCVLVIVLITAWMKLIEREY